MRRKLTRVVLAHPAVADGVRSEEPLALFDATDDPGLEELRYDSLGFLLSGALALGMSGRSLDDLGEPLLHAAVATDPMSLLLRRQLVGKPFGPPTPVLPEWLDKLDEFMSARLLRRRHRRRARAREVGKRPLDRRRQGNQRRGAGERLSRARS